MTDCALLKKIITEYLPLIEMMTKFDRERVITGEVSWS